MKNILIGTAVVVGAIIVGVGGAFGVSRLIKTDQPQTVQVIQGVPGNGDDNLNGRGFGPRGQMPFGCGMMGRGPSIDQQPSQAHRITVDTAVTNAKEAAASVGSNLEVSEVMEFSNNFYVVVKETDTGKGAFELLVDPYSGRVSYEIGPNMMWNLKYGHMRSGTEVSATNTLTMAEAQVKAQTALDSKIKGAVVQPDGIDFYGYYSFDYKVNGTVAGMLSVNGETGSVWFHNWHGTFISEQEITK